MNGSKKKDFAVLRLSWYQGKLVNHDPRELVRTTALFLQENKLTNRTLLEPNTLVPDDFVIMSHDLTDLGFEFMKTVYQKWLGSLDRGVSETDRKILENELLKLQAKSRSGNNKIISYCEILAWDEFLEKLDKNLKSYFLSFNKKKRFRSVIALKQKGIPLLKEEDLNLDDLALFAVNSYPHAAPFVYVPASIELRNIFNLNTDGSFGLCINGTLKAKNIIVGGQILAIEKNIDVDQVFWGDYNHGELFAQGLLKTKVFVATDEYAYDDENLRLQADYIFSDIEEERETEIFDFYKISSVFKEAFIVHPKADDQFGWANFLKSEKVIEAVANNKAIINETIVFKTKEDFELQELESRERLFSESQFNDITSFGLQVGNIRRVITLLMEHHPDQFDFLFQDYQISFSESLAKRPLDEIADHELQLVFTNFQSAEQFLFCRAINADHQPSENTYFSILYTDNLKKPYTDLFTKKSSASKIKKISNLWAQFLIDLECGNMFYSRLRNIVVAKDILEILDLKVVKEKYSDYLKDFCGFWRNDLYFTFNLFGQHEWNGMVSVGKVREQDVSPFDPNYQEDYEHFYFWTDDLEDPKSFNLKYLSSEARKTADYYSEDPKIVLVYHYKILRNAVRLWPKVKPEILQENAEYVDECERQGVLDKKKQHLKARTNIKPVEQIEKNGIVFRVLTASEAQDILKEICDHSGHPIFRIFDDPRYFHVERVNSFFLICEQEVDLDHFIFSRSALVQGAESIFVLGYIFRKNVVCKKSILANDQNISPSLVFLGNVKTLNICVGPGLHYFGKDLSCESLLLPGSDGVVQIMGSLTATMIYSQKTQLFVDTFNQIEYICTLNSGTIQLNCKLKSPSGEIVRKCIEFPSNLFVEDIVSDKWLLGSESIKLINVDDTVNLDLFLAGESILDKKKRKKAQSFRSHKYALSLFHSLFGATENKSRFLTPNQKGRSFNGISCFMKSLSVDSKKKTVDVQEIFHLNVENRIKSTGIYSLKDNRIILSLQYLDVQNNVEFQWQGEAGSEVLELYCVSHALRIAVSELLCEDRLSTK